MQMSLVLVNIYPLFPAGQFLILDLYDRVLTRVFNITMYH